MLKYVSSMGDRLTAGPQPLELLVEVRVLFPQFDYLMNEECSPRTAIEINMYDQVQNEALGFFIL